MTPLLSDVAKVRTIRPRSRSKPVYSTGAAVKDSAVEESDLGSIPGKIYGFSCG